MAPITTRKNATPSSMPSASANAASKPMVEHKPATSFAGGAPISHDEIAKLAYERWLATGADAETNWAEAERMLREQAGAPRSGL